jgi:RHS repeat-associated protein
VSLAALTQGGGKKGSFGVKKPIGFSTGREFDKETGLYYYRARYYDPMEGRFISKDPIGFDGGDVNLYGYVQNNTINNTDPNGTIVRICHRALDWWSWLPQIRLGPLNHTYLDVNNQLIGLHPSGVDLNEKLGKDIKCGQPLQCVDDSCVLQKAKMMPPSYYLGFYDCRAWAETIILLCHKKNCCEGN